MIKKHHISRLEHQLSELVETTFSTLFGNKIHTQDIALELARAMEISASSASDTDGHPIAPDQYLIGLHPTIHQTLIRQHPDLTSLLAKYLIELGTNANYRFIQHPTVRLIADSKLAQNRFTVHATHQTHHNASSTAAMKKVTIHKPDLSVKAHLIINNQEIFHLTEAVNNIGRHPDNHIVLLDNTVSRHHAQIRLRSGQHIIFNAQSLSGTRVNNVQIKEHRLKSGDVIDLGNSRLVYIIESSDTRDDSDDDNIEDGTGVFPAH
jgi:hypothetical protein